MRAAILCPNSNSARFSAGRLLENGIDVTFYCPEALDEEQASDIIHEMNYVGAQQNRLRNTVDSFVVQKDRDLTDCDLILLPCIDVKGLKSNKDYYSVCFNVFRHYERSRVLFHRDAKVIFGWNVAGLMAAKVWADVWPAMTANILITCSVFKATVMNFGEESEDRSLPIMRCPVKLTSSTTDAERAAGILEKKWNNNTFSYCESKLMVEVAALLNRSEALDSLQLIGSFLTTDLAAKYNLPADIPWWLPTDTSDENQWYHDMLPDLKKHLLPSLS